MAQAMATKDSVSERYLVIKQGDRYLGVRIQDIVEIIRMVAINTIPEAGQDLAGVLNYRGEIISIINLWSLLGQPTPPMTPEMGIVIINGKDRKFGITAQEILEVKELKVEPRSDKIDDQIIFPLVSGVAYIDPLDRLALILNTERLRSHHLAAVRLMDEEK